MSTFGFIVPESVKETFRDFSLIINGDVWLYGQGDIKDGYDFTNMKDAKIKENLKELLNRELSEEEERSLDHYSDNNNWHFWPGKKFVLKEDYTLQQQCVGF